MEKVTFKVKVLIRWAMEGARGERERERQKEGERERERKVSTFTHICKKPLESESDPRIPPSLGI